MIMWWLVYHNSYSMSNEGKNMINVTDSEAEVCLNCRHKWRSECTLFDELIEDNCGCFMFEKDN